MVRAIGREVCDEDVLDLSLGESRYGADGVHAEDVLAEADRRMYIMKQRVKATQIAKLDLALNATSDLRDASGERMLVN